jgi:hypothetical protein
MSGKLLPQPASNPVNKDAVIDDLKRKLIATEFLLEWYKQQAINNNKKEYEYWCELQSLKGLEI